MAKVRPAPDGLRLPMSARVFAPDACAMALRLLPLDAIRGNPQQPRKRFDEAGLRRLAASLRACGPIQPIVVRPLSESTTQVVDGNGRDAAGAVYELIAGERRWRAAQLAGLKEIPAIIRDAPDGQLLELSLVENLLRENLNPIEKARAYRVLHVEQGLSHDEIARRMGEDRKTIGNTIRLLELGETALSLIESGALGSEHGKALLGVRDTKAQSELARKAVAKKWSVRHLCRQIKTRAAKGSAPSLQNMSSAEELQRLLAQALNVRVTVLARRRALVTSIRLDWDATEAVDRTISWLRKALEEEK